MVVTENVLCYVHHEGFLSAFAVLTIFIIDNVSSSDIGVWKVQTRRAESSRGKRNALAI